MKSIYIIGAQCTGKTTLTQAVVTKMKEVYRDVELKVIDELARSVLAKHSFTRKDIREDPKKCMLLQRLILEAQHRREMEADDSAVLISDRSGADPLVYAALFAKHEDTEDLVGSACWQELEERMRVATVVVCEPVKDWLVDDGVRLMPIDFQEWEEVHQMFCQLLDSKQIQYEVLPSTLVSLPARTGFVMELWRADGYQR